MAIQVSLSLGRKTRIAITVLVDILLLAGVVCCVYLALSSFDAVGATNDDTGDYDGEDENMAVADPSGHAPPVLPSKKATGDAFSPAKTPEEAVKGFYDALKRKKCTLARSYRPGYDKCEKVSSVRYIKIKKKYVGGNRAVFHIDVSLKLFDGEPEHFEGFIRVDKQHNRWVINNRLYHSDMSFDDYYYSYVSGQQE